MRFVELFECCGLNLKTSVFLDAVACPKCGRVRCLMARSAALEQLKKLDLPIVEVSWPRTDDGC